MGLNSFEHLIFLWITLPLCRGRSGRALAGSFLDLLIVTEHKLGQAQSPGEQRMVQYRRDKLRLYRHRRWHTARPRSSWTLPHNVCKRSDLVPRNPLWQDPVPG